MPIFVRSTPWLMTLQGLLLVIFGGVVLAYPEVSLAALTRLLGFFLILAGIFMLISSRFGRSETNPILLFEGIFELGLGAIFAIFPQAVASAFIVILGIITFLAGLAGLWFLVRARAPLFSIAVLRNTLILLFGLFLLVNPLKGQAALAVIIGVFSLVFGIISLYSGYRMFRLNKSGKSG